MDVITPGVGHLKCKTKRCVMLSEVPMMNDRIRYTCSGGVLRGIVHKGEFREIYEKLSVWRRHQMESQL